MYSSNSKIIYFDSFGVEHIPKEIKKFRENKNVTINIFRTQAYNLITCGYFCIGFIDFMLIGKSLTELTNLFLPNNLKQNDATILSYFKNG